jgi:hypothetical protein
MTCLAHPTLWVDDYLRRLLHEHLGQIRPTDVQRVPGPGFYQNRHPRGVTDLDLQWAKMAYFDRLLRGVLLQSVVTTEGNGTPGPMSDAVCRIVLDEQRQPPSAREEACLRTQLLSCMQERFELAMPFWAGSEDAYGNATLATWAEEHEAASDRDRVCQGTTDDVLGYLRMVRKWPVYVEQIERLQSKSSDWLQGRVLL